MNILRETGESFLEICPENKRDRKTLEGLIQKRVPVGTKILTDGWAGYKQLEKLGNFFWIFVFLFIIEISGYFWDFVNHSENFRKPEDHSVHTNTIQYKVLFLMLLKVLMYSNLI